MTSDKTAQQTLAQRQAFAEKIPWIRRLKNGVPCEEYRWREVPLSALYPWGPNRSKPPTGLEPYRCKKTAFWSFRASKKSYTKSGKYCWAHLMTGMFHDVEESTRFDRWYARHPEIQYVEN